MLGCEDSGSPITHGQMQDLLDPLHASLQQMEATMRALFNEIDVMPEIAAKTSSVRSLSGTQPQNPTIISIDDIKVSELDYGLAASKALTNGTVTKKAQDCELEDEWVSKLSTSVPVDTTAASNSQNSELADEWVIQTATDEHPNVTESEWEQPAEEEDQHADDHAHLKHSTSCYALEEAPGSGMEFIEDMRINQELSHSHFAKVSAVEKSILRLVEAVVHVWKVLEEPKRHGRLFNAAHSHSFQTACMLAIMLNSILVAYMADWQIQNIGATEPLFLEVVEIGFLIFFIFELALRLGAHGCYFFVNHDMYWNVFDFILVSISLVDFIFSKLIGAEGGNNVGFMRLLRLLKLARIFRSLRSFKFFKSLAVLLESFQKSFVCLFWGSILLAFVLYLFSLIFMQALVECLTSGDIEEGSELRSNIIKYFGSLGKTFISLYMSVTGGNDWYLYYDIICCAGSIYGFLYVFFTFLLYFALFNILTGSLVEKAMSSSKPDRADRVLNQRKAFAEQRRHFVDICKAMDEDGNGMISWNEFQNCIANPAMLSYMASIGIEVHDVRLFFETVAGSVTSDEDPGEIPIDHLIEGCMHMKGTATAIDMQRQLVEINRLHKDLLRFEASFTDRFSQH